VGRLRGIAALLTVSLGLLSGCRTNNPFGMHWTPAPPVYRRPNPREPSAPAPARANPSEPSGISLPPPPPPGSNRWDVVGHGGAQRHGETTATPETWIWIDADGNLHARIPPSAETRAAAGAVGPDASVSIQQGR
jgi:hypothetical protein